ncbi:zinc finger protein 12-like [Drosophila serrata]|uniref:zinc finger protein 12-like n=1 Tax=Drosophila serrata TaxID=7274 RepID=UPI000A1CF90D|nr:zinc finger protein 12-like [Drosophila serrata]
MESLPPPALEPPSTETNNMDTAICRVCMANERLMVNIFGTPPGSSTSIANMISQCTGIYISHRQTYPKTICRPCVLDAQNAYEFKQTFEKSHHYFSQIKEKVCVILDVDKESDQVKKEGFEICFLEKEEPKQSITDQVKNEPSDAEHVEANPSEGTGASEDNASSSSSERPFKCSQCQKTFIRKHQLATHIRIHTGERPFQCEHCPKSFTQKHILKIHLHTHTGERPFKCSHCPKSFAQKSTQLAHIRIHTGERPFACSECPRSFFQQAHLQKHFRKHSGERSYHCSRCPQSFSDRSNLQRHCRTHTKEGKAM